jgi:hypothetical protein
MSRKRPIITNRNRAYFAELGTCGLQGRKSVRKHSNIMGAFGALKARVSCQNLLPPKRRIAGRYGAKIETF